MILAGCEEHYKRVGEHLHKNSIDKQDTYTGLEQWAL